MPAEKPIVSALIVSFNVKPLLLKCLEAFYGHADVPVEAVVVDNASTDGSAAAVASEFPKAVVLAQQRNLGFGRANNVGLERCQGRFVLLLNPDVTVNPQALGRMAASTPKRAAPSRCRARSSTARSGSAGSFRAAVCSGGTTWATCRRPRSTRSMRAAPPA